MTPMEELALEVLASRHRLGEQVWTFESRHAPALRGLEREGLAFTMHGVMQGTLRAGLTEKGFETALGASYRLPLVLELDDETLASVGTDYGEAVRQARKGTPPSASERVFWDELIRLGALEKNEDHEEAFDG